MATVNLGRIKPVFRGAYAGGTAYVVDDIVTHGNETFICIQAGTGNATSNASYWTKLAAKGADGSDGTDVGTTLTTQGDILYRDGSGLARLAAGTSGQFLKTQGSGANPVWATNESNYEKLYSVGAVAAASEINLNGYFNDAYDTYRILGQFYDSSGGGAFYMQMRTGTNGATLASGNDYHYAYDFLSRNSSGGTQSNEASSYNTTSIRMGWNGSNFSNKEQYPISLDITIHQPNTSGRRTSVIFGEAMWDNAYFGHAHGAGFFDNTTQVTGLRLSGGGNMAANYIKIYGYK